MSCSSSPPREIELKLEVSEAGLRRLQRHPKLRELAVGRTSSRRLRSVYFDTPELDLYRHGIGLRIRAVGGQRIQTVKIRGSQAGGLFDRGEYECSISSEQPDLDRIPDVALRDRLRVVIGDRPLREIFSTEMRRTRRLLSDGSSQWTLDADLGEVRTGTASAPICELELELREGDPRSLFDLALELLDSVPLKPATESKADRGYALLAGARPAPRKAGAVVLRRGQPLEEALEATARSCLDQITANAIPAGEGGDPEGVHQMRVGVRRLRSALACFGDVLPASQRDWLRNELRWLAGALGAVRDLDVFADELLGPILRREPRDPALKRLRDEALALRDRRRDDVREVVASERYARLILTLARWLSCREWREQPLSEAAARLFQPAEAHAAKVLRKLHRRVHRLGREIESAPVPLRHELRLQLKKLRYAAEFFASLYEPKQVRRYAKRVRALQELLGHLNDVATAERITADLLVELSDEARPEHFQAVGYVLGWAARRAAEDDARLARRWRRYERMRPFWR